jgi:hypothetical protein
MSWQAFPSPELLFIVSAHAGSGSRPIDPSFAEVQAATSSRMSAGTRVGELATSHYPDGLLIGSESLAQAVADTTRALAGRPRPIFEATFDANDVLIRADILLPDCDGYRMIEVKSSTSVKKYHYEDSAVQTWVAREAGLPLTGIEIAYINRAFVYPGGGDYGGLFAHSDISEKVSGLESQVTSWADAARATLAMKSEPDIAVGEQCNEPFPCPFINHCSPPVDENAYPDPAHLRTRHLFAITTPDTHSQACTLISTVQTSIFAIPPALGITTQPTSIPLLRLRKGND